VSCALDEGQGARRDHHDVSRSPRNRGAPGYFRRRVASAAPPKMIACRRAPEQAKFVDTRSSSRYTRPGVWYIRAIVSVRPRETSFLASAREEPLTMVEEMATFVAKRIETQRGHARQRDCRCDRQNRVLSDISFSWPTLPRRASRSDPASVSRVRSV